MQLLICLILLSTLMAMQMVADRPFNFSYHYKSRYQKFKEKFPKACRQMNNITQIDYFREPNEPAAHFFQNQIIELLVMHC